MPCKVPRTGRPFTSRPCPARHHRPSEAAPEASSSYSRRPRSPSVHLLCSGALYVSSHLISQPVRFTFCK